MKKINFFGEALDMAAWSAEDGGMSLNCLLANDFEANADLLADFDGDRDDTTSIVTESLYQININ